MDHGHSSGDGEILLDSGFILRIETAGSAGRLNVSKRKEGVKVLGFSTSCMELPSTEMEKMTS